jgi:hypothetical protein
MRKSFITIDAPTVINGRDGDHAMSAPIALGQRSSPAHSRASTALSLRRLAVLDGQRARPQR